MAAGNSPASTLRENALGKVEAAVWGMPAVNYEIMRTVMSPDGSNEFLYWSRLLDWQNQTLTPNPDLIYYMAFMDPGADGPVPIRVMGGRRPLTFLVDGLALPSAAAGRSALWQPSGPGFYTLSAQDADGAGTRLIMEAIATRRGLWATYNGQVAKLAPHMLYTRHGELHLGAVVLERDRKPPRERKIGTFKLTGLSGLKLSDDGFEPESLFDAADPRYAETTVFSVAI